MKLYIESSVPNMLYAEDALEKRAAKAGVTLPVLVDPALAPAV